MFCNMNDARLIESLTTYDNAFHVRCQIKITAVHGITINKPLPSCLEITHCCTLAVFFVDKYPAPPCSPCWVGKYISK